MTKIVLNPILNSNNYNSINSNFDEVESAINDDVVHLKDGNNVMNQALDMNGFPLLNMRSNPSDPNSVITQSDLTAVKDLVSSINSTQTNESNRLTALESANLPDRVTSVENNQKSGMIGYATKALMDADLSKPDATLAQVTNDATLENNQSYRKSGAAGTGSWVASVDRIAQVYKDMPRTDFKKLGISYATPSDQGAAIVAALNLGLPLIASGDIYLGSSITVAGKSIDVEWAAGARLYGPGTLTLTGSMGTAIAASNVAEGSQSVTGMSSTPATGTWVVVAGTVTHSGYTPTRHTAGSVTAKVTGTSGSTIFLDRAILFALAGVTVTPISTPYGVRWKGGKLDGSALVVQRAVLSSSIALEATGAGNGLTQAIALDQCTDVAIDLLLHDVSSTIGVAFTNCHTINGSIVAHNVGVGDGSKAVNSDGLQNSCISLVSTGALRADWVADGARGVTLQHTGDSCGQYYRQAGITTSNRCECVQFTESNDIRYLGNLSNVDDQAVEFLAVTRGVLDVRASSLTGATEGLVVVKGASLDVDVYPRLDYRNIYGVKVECVDGATGIRIHDPDIRNPVSTSTGIIIRDSTVAIDVNVDINGGYVEASAPITVLPNHNGYRIKGTTTKTVLTGNVAISCQGNNGVVQGTTCLDGTSGVMDRSVYVAGAGIDVHGVVSTKRIYLASAVAPTAYITALTGNATPSIFTDYGGGVTVDWPLIASELTTASRPGSGTWKKGTFIRNNAPVIDANNMLVAGWCRLTDGNGNVNNTDWKAVYFSTVSPAT